MKQVKFDDIVGHNLVISQMRTRFDKYVLGAWNKRKNIRKPKGVVFEGAPGVGKSMICDAIICEYVLSNSLFKYHDIDKSIVASKDNNGTTKKVNNLFSVIRDDPEHIHIIKIEEADDMFISRKVNRAHAGELTSAWLKNLEGYNAPDNFYILATSNYIERWDIAIVDRLEAQYTLYAPEIIERNGLIQKLIVDEFEICDLKEEHIVKWAKNSKGLTGRDFSKIALRLDDEEFKLKQLNKGSMLTTMIISFEITQQQQFKQNEINVYRDNWKEEW